MFNLNAKNCPAFYTKEMFLKIELAFFLKMFFHFLYCTNHFKNISARNDGGKINFSFLKSATLSGFNAGEH